jgi:hypothetical protein
MICFLPRPTRNTVVPKRLVEQLVHTLAETRVRSMCRVGWRGRLRNFLRVVGPMLHKGLLASARGPAVILIGAQRTHKHTQYTRRKWAHRIKRFAK